MHSAVTKQGGFLGNLRSLDGAYAHWAINIGANIQYNHIGVIVEYGYRNSGYSYHGDVLPSLGINQHLLKMGISYRIGQPVKNKPQDSTR